MSARRATIIAEVNGLVGGFLYYDRKEDEDLPRGAIEAAIKDGEITTVEIVALFKIKLEEGLEQLSRSSR